ncbi:MAG: U32 family peptidase [Bacteroidales bacterium]|nr:U32 family peptidase [Bacteroidales bacterium]
MKKIELLAPARDTRHGIEAVKHGADAVYIGAIKFGARAAATNNLNDMEELCRFAHQYHAKVYVTLNTILTDKEIEEAVTLAHKLYLTGIDALIIQDMGLLMHELPSIPLHASTQMHNLHLAHILFLQKVGFQRAILARELSLPDIANISQNTDIELEAFVHGAACVSYSGQCYMSLYSHGRSANRGVCAQCCRQGYDLTDATGKILLKNRYLLSLKDIQRVHSIKDMILAGITSFKIEGRLKSMSYVKNITTFYRQHLDTILETDRELVPASSGKCRYTFIPDPAKTFQRDHDNYFLHHRTENMANLLTPKSLGEYAGVVEKVEKNSIIVKTDILFANGDGLLFVTKSGKTGGFRVNRQVGNRLFPAQMPPVDPSTLLYRNHDHTLDKLLSGTSACRTIKVSMFIKDTEEGILISCRDEDHYTVSHVFEIEKEFSQKVCRAEENLRQQMSKTGNTPFEIEHIEIQLSRSWFIPLSRMSVWKRLMINLLLNARENGRKKGQMDFLPPCPDMSYPYPSSDGKLTFRANVFNRYAKAFYLMHGVKEVEPALEDQITKNPVVMSCRYCLKHELGWCPKQKRVPLPIFQEPLFLNDHNHRYKLIFNCIKCEMDIVAVENKQP